MDTELSYYTPSELDTILSLIFYYTCDDVSINNKYKEEFKEIIPEKKIPSYCYLTTKDEQMFSIRYRLEFRLFSINYSVNGSPYKKITEQRNISARELLTNMKNRTSWYGNGLLLNFCTMKNNTLIIGDEYFQFDDSELQKLKDFNSNYIKIMNQIIYNINEKMEISRQTYLTVKLFSFLPFTSVFQDFDLLERFDIEINEL